MRRNESIRVIPDQVLGAILGVWLGATTHIWEKTPFEIIIFVFFFMFISILVNIVSADFNPIIRVVVSGFLVIVIIGSGVIFRYPMNLMTDNETWFYYILLFGWLLIGVVSKQLEKILVRAEVIFVLRPKE
ncbi:MAG: hypothetical protein ABI700_01885 [Chloroflexota bacterium]